MQTANPRRSTETRQAEIIAAALQLAAQRSPGLITTTEIATALNLTQGALFKHFPNKDSIWRAVMDQVAEQLLGTLQAAAEQATTPCAALRAMFMAHVEFVMQHPGVPQLIFSELQQPDDTPIKQRVRSLLEQYRRRLLQLLAAAAAQGQCAANLDQPAAATLFIGTIQGLIMQSMLAGSTLRMRSEAERLFSLYLSAIGGPA